MSTLSQTYSEDKLVFVKINIYIEKNMNENEDLRRRVTEAEAKIRYLEDVVHTLAAENFDLRGSLAEIKRKLGLPEDESAKRLCQNEDMNLIRLFEDSKKAQETSESSVEKEEIPLIVERQSLQNPEIHHEIESGPVYKKFSSLTPKPPSNEVDDFPQNLDNHVEGQEDGNRGIFKPKRLFENFLVIGVPKEEIPDYLKSSQLMYESISSEMSSNNDTNRTKILFNFAESAQVEPNITLPDIEKFITPSDFRVIDLKDAPETANEVFAKTVLKSERKYNRKYICPFQPFNNGILLKWHKEVDTFNPQRKLYAICIKKRDYLIVDENMVSVDMIYCMLTYYPIPSLIFNLLTSILNLIRKVRYELGGKDKKRMDSEILNEIFSNQVKEYLKVLLTIPQPMPSDTIEYRFNNDSSGRQEVREYSYGLNSQAYLELAGWQACKTFGKLGLENIKFLISALLLEKWIIFISQDIVTLTSVLNTILGLLCPFKYLYSIVPNLPPKSVRLCGAPVPITICINQREDYFWDTRLYEHSQNIFVFLDSQIIYVDSTHPEFSSIPVLDCLSQGIDDLYKELNPQNSSFRMITDFDRLKSVHPSQIPERSGQFEKEKEISREEKEKCQKLFKHFRTQLERNIANNMTYFKGYSPVQAQNLDLEQQIERFIKSQNNKEFFKSFITTQGFLTYPDY